MYTILFVILIIQVNKFYADPLEVENIESVNNHDVEIESGEKIQSMTDLLSKIIQENDYELEKQQYYDMLRRKLGLNSRSNDIYLYPKRKAENAENKRNQYYTRPCLLNAISCYFYG
jgi:hypothetical protein